MTHTIKPALDPAASVRAVLTSPEDRRRVIADVDVLLQRRGAEAERCMGSSRSAKDSLNAGARLRGICAWCGGPVRVTIDGRALAHEPTPVGGRTVLRG